MKVCIKIGDRNISVSWIHGNVYAEKFRTYEKMEKKPYPSFIYYPYVPLQMSPKFNED